MSHTNDATTTQMIMAAQARRAKPNADSVVTALLDARFRAFEIDLRLDAVIAGVRKVNRTVTIPTLDVA